MKEAEVIAYQDKKLICIECKQPFHSTATEALPELPR